MAISTKSVASGVEIDDGKGNKVVIPFDEVKTILPDIQKRSFSVATTRAALIALVNDVNAVDTALQEAFAAYVNALAASRG